jgi:hypothetical protein
VCPLLGQKRWPVGHSVALPIVSPGEQTKNNDFTASQETLGNHLLPRTSHVDLGLVMYQLEYEHHCEPCYHEHADEIRAKPVLRTAERKERGGQFTRHSSLAG